MSFTAWKHKEGQKKTEKEEKQGKDRKDRKARKDRKKKYYFMRFSDSSTVCNPLKQPSLKPT